MVRLYAETEEGATVVLNGKTRAHYAEAFRTMFENALDLLAQRDRPACYYRVLMHLLTKLDAVQWRVTSAFDISQELSISRASAERGLAMLEADRVILAEGPRCARRRRLNNRVAWRSSATKHNEADKDPEVIDGRGRC